MQTLLSQLSSNLNAFAESLQEMNVYNDVTLFTLSDFNRGPCNQTHQGERTTRGEAILL